jgi:hypothetical protein
MSALATTQGRVFASVVGEDNTFAALDDLIEGGALSADQRLEIYSEMYFLRMRDSLHEDTPHVAKLVDPHEFEHLVVGYMKDAPSTHYSLARFGHLWPKFLKERARHLPRADLGDLAVLEWARAESFVAPDSPELDVKAPSQMGPEKFVAARLDFTPSVKLLKLEYDVLPLWAAMERNEAAPGVVWRPVQVMVWRKGLEVFHIEVAKEEFRAAQAAASGGTVELMCEAFAKKDEAAQVAFAAISSWFEEGMVAALR